MVVTRRTDGEPTDWAKYVKEAVAQCGGNVSLLRQKSGVSRSSLYRWMSDDGTRVTIEKARQIAEAIGDDPRNAIRAAGSLLDTGDERDARLDGLDPTDPVVRHIMTLGVDEEMRTMMLNRHRENLARDRQRYLEEIEFWANQDRRRGAA